VPPLFFLRRAIAKRSLNLKLLRPLAEWVSIDPMRSKRCNCTTYTSERCAYRRPLANKSRTPSAHGDCTATDHAHDFSCWSRLAPRRSAWTTARPRPTRPNVQDERTHRGPSDGTPLQPAVVRTRPTGSASLAQRAGRFLPGAECTTPTVGPLYGPSAVSLGFWVSGLRKLERASWTMSRLGGKPAAACL
jgi:hypothetical protein